jgi:hypothetical protein
MTFIGYDNGDRIWASVDVVTEVQQHKCGAVA